MAAMTDASTQTADEFLWLEEIEGAAALDWVRKHNKRSLDLLEGDAISGGGTPRHSIEFNGGVFYKGIGSFFNGTWKAPTTLAASGLPGTSDLRFGSTTAINLVLFMDFGQRPKLIEKVGFLKGARMSLRFENLLNSRQKVTDGSGAVPLSYQPDYLDPRGRVITLQFRKMF